MRSLVLSLISVMALACSQALPVPDPLPMPNDAGPSPCTNTEVLAGRCIQGLGEGIACTATPFSTSHAWANSAVTLRFVDQSGTGDGQTATTAAGSISEALIGVSDSAVILLGAGTFEPPAQLPAQTTIIGRCAADSILSISANNRITRAQDQSLRLWGLSVDASTLSDQHTAVEFTGAGHFETHHTRWSSGANAIAVQGTAVVQNATFGAVGQIALGVTGPLSSVIVGDNHFLGPISGEGVFLGPISGEGVFRVSGNTFAQIDGNALSITDAASSVIVGDNHFLGPISGEGVFLGPASSEFSIQNNRFEQVSGSALVVQDISGGGSIANNTITAQEGSPNGIGIAILDATSAAVSVTDNSVISATQAALLIVRTSAEITAQNNTLSSTQLPQEVGGDNVFAYGAMILDSGHISLISNTIDNHPTAGVLYDLERWGTYIRRNDLSGTVSWRSENNTYTNNRQHDEVSQNTEDTPANGARPPDLLPSESEPLPTARQNGRATCGDGRTSGSELCDPNDPSNRSVCTADCTFIQDQRSASGGGFSCFIGSDYNVYCVVSNARKEILSPELDDEIVVVDPEITVPTRIELGAHRFVGVTAGRNHACAITIDGLISCWGDRTYGAVGQCDDQDIWSSAAIFVQKQHNQNTFRLSDVRSIASHLNTTCAVTFNNEVYCWGQGVHGLRDQDAPAHCATRALQQSPHTVSTLSLGAGYGCTRSADGEVACWGLNQGIQLGRDTQETCTNQSDICSGNPLTVQIPASKHVVTGRAACALGVEDEKLRCWGPTNDLSLPASMQGNDVRGRGRLPSLIDNLGAVTEFGLGHFHGCLVERDTGELKCWGNSGSVWSGQARSQPARTPSRLPNIPDEVHGLAVVDLTVGHNHTCTLRSDRIVRCWGMMLQDTQGQDIAVPRNDILYGVLP